MKRVRMVVAYDGTAYRGWQLQPNGITIEEVLNRELTALLKESISVIGASVRIPAYMPVEMWRFLIRKTACRPIRSVLP
ncbi:hypothetical protein [Clostridium sp. OF09-36]|uniref:hypothetical protein n=1 Tax=Clostridium sp. OF09-36 TaxID=2292310 RepID=UPI00325AC9CC